MSVESAAVANQGKIGSDEAVADSSKWLHWFFLFASLAIIGLSFILTTPDDLQVTYAGYSLPELCTFKRLMGIDCPGCGMTRAFICISDGAWARAWFLNPAGFMMYLVIAIQIPYRIVQLVRVKRRLPSWSEAWFGWFLIATTVLMIVQWLVRIFGGYY